MMNNPEGVQGQFQQPAPMVQQQPDGMKQNQVPGQPSPINENKMHPMMYSQPGNNDAASQNILSMLPVKPSNSSTNINQAAPQGFPQQQDGAA